MRRAPKYRNKKTVLDGETFDSAGEARRWAVLKLMQRAGSIADLRRQVPIKLVDGCKLAGASRARPPIRLVVDFVYRDTATGGLVHEDFKGDETDVSRIKRHMAKVILGIDVVLSCSSKN